MYEAIIYYHLTIIVSLFQLLSFLYSIEISLSFFRSIFLSLIFLFFSLSISFYFLSLYFDIFLSIFLAFLSSVASLFLFLSLQTTLLFYTESLCEGKKECVLKEGERQTEGVQVARVRVFPSALWRSVNGCFMTDRERESTRGFIQRVRESVEMQKERLKPLMTSHSSLLSPPVRLSFCLPSNLLYFCLVYAKLFVSLKPKATDKRLQHFLLKIAVRDLKV